MDFYPSREEGKRPLVIYTHGTGQTKNIQNDSALYHQIVRPALEAGLSFISLDYRHPTINRSESDTQLDIVKALQFTRFHADLFQISPNKVFSLSHSRGSLALWSALQDEKALPDDQNPLKRQSTLFQGVYSVQGHGTYSSEKFAQLFLAPRLRTIYVSQNSHGPHIGHAIGDVSRNDPPLKLIYNGPLEMLPISNLEDVCKENQDPFEIPCIDLEHLSNSGNEICKAYASLGKAKECEIRFNVKKEHSFDQYINFFRSLL